MSTVRRVTGPFSIALLCMLLALSPPAGAAVLAGIGDHAHCAAGRHGASIVNPDQLAAAAPANDPDTVVLQLCALVLRCGWIWQPVLIRPR